MSHDQTSEFGVPKRRAVTRPCLQATLWVLVLGLGISSASPDDRFNGTWGVDLERTYAAGRDSIGPLSLMPLSELVKTLNTVQVVFSPPNRVRVQRGDRAVEATYSILKSKGDTARMLFEHAGGVEPLSARFSKERLWLRQGFDTIALERK